MRKAVSYLLNSVSRDLHVFLSKESFRFSSEGTFSKMREENEVDKKMNHNSEAGPLYSIAFLIFWYLEPRFLINDLRANSV